MVTCRLTVSAEWAVALPCRMVAFLTSSVHLSLTAGHTCGSAEMHSQFQPVEQDDTQEHFGLCTPKWLSPLWVMDYKSWRSSLFSCLQSPLTSSHLSPNIFLSILLSNTHTLFFFIFIVAPRILKNQSMYLPAHENTHWIHSTHQPTICCHTHYTTGMFIFVVTLARIISAAWGWHAIRCRNMSEQ